jgi:glycosyltransferase involved in cell wall biosynthesis
MNNVLLAHEWIEADGGAERVFRELLGLWPDADAVCLWNDIPEEFEERVMESSLSRLPMRSKTLVLPLMPAVWRRFPIERYDLVVASSHMFAHHLAARAAARGIRGFVYVHTPLRYLWSPDVDPRGTSMVARVGRGPLRFVDRRGLHVDTRLAANSAYVRRRIARAWNRDAEVIYPPVPVQEILSWRRDQVLSEPDQVLLDSLPGTFLLGASRLVQYKRLDLVIDIGEQLDLPVVIAGTGPDESRLRARAGDSSVPVVFAGRVSDRLLYALYARSELFCFLAVEDFGIMPVEALAAGARVLVNAQGGAREIVDLVGGGVAVDVSAAHVSELAEVAERAMSAKTASVDGLTTQFSREAFRGRVREWTEMVE